MGTITITVPAQYAGVFRMNAFALYESRADGLLVTLTGYREYKATSGDVLIERDRLDALEPVLDQLDWELSHEEGDLKIVGDQRVLRQIVAGCVHDAGHRVADFCQRLDADSDDIAAWTRQVNWFAQQRDELSGAEAVAS